MPYQRAPLESLAQRPAMTAADTATGRILQMQRPPPKLERPRVRQPGILRAASGSERILGQYPAVHVVRCERERHLMCAFNHSESFPKLRRLVPGFEREVPELRKLAIHPYFADL